jgi:23S rRNA (guanine745-N1)-methyltransferase
MAEVPAALRAVLDRLRCPVCGEALAAEAGALRCPRRHGFDVARRGWVTLAGRRPSPHAGDSEAMVSARHAFLEAGHFAPIADAARDAALDVLGPRAGAPGCVLDVGAGTGHHLRAVLGGLPGWAGVALDVSRPALRRAVRADPRIAGIAADAWAELPVRDAAIDLGLIAFAPRNGAELGRVLAPGAGLVVVTPAERHLAELVAPLGLLRVDPAKRERLAERLAPHLAPVARRDVTFTMALAHDDVARLVAMGPSAHHVGGEELGRRLRALPDPCPVTAAVVVETLRHAPPPPGAR